MKRANRARLETAGWKTGSAKDFPGLSEEDATFSELKLALARSLRTRRERRKMTQKELATLVESSQSRVAKMEAGDGSVSVDLFGRSRLAIGTTKRQLARNVATPRAAKAA